MATERPVPRGIDLEGKTALVTGAGGAIGSVISVSLAEAGASVVMTGRTTESVEAVVPRHLVETGLVVSGDLTSEDFIRQLVSRALDSFGSIDILVNAAGINRRTEAQHASLELWREVFSVNVDALFLLTREVGSHMIESGSGSIVNIASTVAFVGSNRRQSPYAASKGAVVSLTRSLAVEWAARGVRVNAIAPTFIATPMNKPVMDDPEKAAEVLSAIPMGRFGEPEDVANGVLYLASDLATFVTGHVLRVDGGYLAV